MVKTDGRPTIAWADPPTPPTRHRTRQQIANQIRELEAEYINGGGEDEELARRINALWAELAA